MSSTDVPIMKRSRRPWTPPVLSVESTRNTATGKSGAQPEAIGTSPACPGCPPFAWDGPLS